MTIIQLNITKPIIIIDQSYYIFNRFYATLRSEEHTSELSHEWISRMPSSA